MALSRWQANLAHECPPGRKKLILMKLLSELVHVILQKNCRQQQITVF